MWIFKKRTAQSCASSPTLTHLRAGDTAEVSCVDAGHKARYRLASLGLIPGSVLQVVASAGAGPMLLSVGESRIMLERGVAEKVRIRKKHAPAQ
jgi:ferrous iron transport protein A